MIIFSWPAKGQPKATIKDYAECKNPSRADRKIRSQSTQREGAPNRSKLRLLISHCLTSLGNYSTTMPQCWYNNHAGRNNILKSTLFSSASKERDDDSFLIILKPKRNDISSGPVSLAGSDRHHHRIANEYLVGHVGNRILNPANLFPPLIHQSIQETDQIPIQPENTKKKIDKVMAFIRHYLLFRGHPDPMLGAGIFFFFHRFLSMPRPTEQRERIGHQAFLCPGIKFRIARCSRNFFFFLFRKGRKKGI